MMLWERLRGIVVEQCCRELPSQIFQRQQHNSPIDHSHANAALLDSQCCWITK